MTYLIHSCWIQTCTIMCGNFLRLDEIKQSRARMNDIYITWMRGNNIYNGGMRANNSVICLFLRLNKKWLKNEWEWKGKYQTWFLMTNITSSHFPFVNGQLWDFLKLSSPANLNYQPVPPCSVPFIFLLMVDSLVFAQLVNWDP